MVTGSQHDDWIIPEYQAEMRRQADHYRLAKKADNDDKPTAVWHQWPARSLLIVRAALALFIGH